MRDKTLILDLDDTIFPTKSMDSKLFEPFWDDLIQRLKSSFDQMIIKNIVNDLWNRPVDFVIKKYKISEGIMKRALEILNNLDVNLKIKPFPDYKYLKDTLIPKYLITSGITKLQKAKIKALKIENDFVEIIINDSIKSTKTKKDLFSELVKKDNLIPGRTYVIGDNPDSEIEAGNELNMITIQILRDNIRRGDNARFYINSFNELAMIIN